LYESGNDNITANKFGDKMIKGQQSFVQTFGQVQTLWRRHQHKHS